MQNCSYRTNIFYHLARILLLHAIFFVTSTSSAQKDPIKEIIEQPYEKIYVHLDKAYYTAGEDIWYKVYLLDGMSHKAQALSEIVYVELIDPVDKIIVRRTIKTKKGSGAADFRLPPGSMHGEYTLRAYTNYMRNFNVDYFLRKTIFVNSGRTSTESPLNTEDSSGSVPPVDAWGAKPDLQFFPEGGQMVNGFLNHIAFKVVGSDGKGVDISGEIRDEEGNKVTEFKTTHLGMGLLQFIPQADKNYYAFVGKKSDELSFPLPSAQKKGTIMTLVEAVDHYRIDIRSSAPNGVSDFRIVGKQKNGIVLDGKIEAKKRKTAAVVSLPKNDLETGIVQFTLFDGDNMPLAERLIFHGNPATEMEANISTSKKDYGQRELVSLEIDLALGASEDLWVDLSMAVTNISVAQPEFQILDIKTYLLLASELKGEIEQPGYYFYTNDPQRKKNLDLLMMTQGWRKFVVQDELPKPDSGLSFLPERGITLKGSLKNHFDRRKPFDASITLTYQNDEEFGHDKVKTDEQGRFIFRNLNFNDTTSVILQSLAKASKRKNGGGNPDFVIEVDSVTFPDVIMVQNRKDRSAFPKIEKYLTQPKNARSISRSFILNNKTIQLDEAVVKAKKIKPLDNYTRKRSSALYTRPSHSLDFKDLRDKAYLNVFEALRGRIPGVNIFAKGIVLRGASSFGGENQPLYLVDGLPVIGAKSIADIPISDIDFVDVIHSSKAGIYASRAGNGIIAVYTLDGRERFYDIDRADNLKGTIKFKHPGFYHARKFYEPAYNIKKPEHSKLDHRTTLCWRPHIKVNKNGKAKVSFYTADISSGYKVKIEGITSTGKPLKLDTFFEVSDTKEQ